MGYTYSQKYAFAIAGGAVLLLFVIFMLFKGEDSYDAAQHQTIFHAQELMRSGDTDQAINVLEDLVLKTENPDALRLLAIEYSREGTSYYNINRAVIYAERLKEKQPSEESFYQSIKAQALQSY